MRKNIDIHVNAPRVFKAFGLPKPHEKSEGGESLRGIDNRKEAGREKTITLIIMQKKT
jgi:hypothetical protein